MIKGEMTQLWTGAICVKKELFQITGGFRVGARSAEDLDMWLRLSLVSPVVWKNESKALYIMDSENSLMRTFKSKDFFPYWEWYSYSSSFYLKIYTNQKLITPLKHFNFKKRIHLLSKISWWSHFIYKFFIKKN